MDKVKIDAGMAWKPAIRKAIRESDYFIAILSKGSVKKRRGNTNYELYEAIDVLREFPPDQVFLIPARVNNCSSPFEELAKLNYLDFFPEWKEGAKNLLNTLGVKTVKRPALTSDKLQTVSVAAKKTIAIVNGDIWKLGKNVEDMSGVYNPVVQKSGRSTPLKRGRNSSSALTRFNKSELFKLVSDTPKLSAKKSPRYHYRIGVVDIDNDLPNLGKVIRVLNKAQRYFFFETVEMPKVRGALQMIDGLKNYNVSHIPQKFIQKNKHMGCDFMLCVTKYPLAFIEKDRKGNDWILSNYFSGPSDYDERFMFVSTDQLDEMSERADRSFEEGVVYMMVGQLLAYFTDSEFHNATRGCVLDFCENRADIVKGFMKRTLCPSCSRKLPKGEMRDAIMWLLKWEYKK